MGDKVKGGQVLAVLDASQAVAQVGQAESQVNAAQANLAMAQDDDLDAEGAGRAR